MRISTGLPWLFVATLTLVACDAEDLMIPPQQTEASIAAEHEFVAELMLTDLLMIMPWMAGETGGTSTFAGRCDPAANWLSYFGITGTLPHLGSVDGSASHCAYLDPTGEYAVLYDQGFAWLRSASGDDALMEYGDGRAWLAEDGAMAFEDAWSFEGGTGRFAQLSGAGTGFGTFSDQQAVAGEDVGYLMRGTMAYDNPLSSGPSFRARAPRDPGSVPRSWPAVGGSLLHEPGPGPGLLGLLYPAGTGDGNAPGRLLARNRILHECPDVGDNAADQ